MHIKITYFFNSMDKVERKLLKKHVHSYAIKKKRDYHILKDTCYFHKLSCLKEIFVYDLIWYI